MGDVEAGEDSKRERGKGGMREDGGEIGKERDEEGEVERGRSAVLSSATRISTTRFDNLIRDKMACISLATQATDITADKRTHLNHVEAAIHNHENTTTATTTTSATTRVSNPRLHRQPGSLPRPLTMTFVPLQSPLPSKSQFALSF